MLLTELFQLDEVGGVGVVAANKKMAKDPRYSMSMTTDIKPGETQKQARKFGNSVDKMGIPPVANTNGQVSEAVMSTTAQGQNPVSAGARGLMGARFQYDVNVKAAEGKNIAGAVDLLASRAPEVEQVTYDSIDQVMKEICTQFNIPPQLLHDAFIKRFNLTPDRYAVKVKHDRKSKPKPV